VSAVRAVVSAWSAICGFGDGRQAFAKGLAAGHPARLVPDFDIADRLGPKGTGSMDRSSALAVATVGRLLEDEGVAVDARTGVVLGTTSGSTRTQFDFTRDSLVRRKPFFVNPAMMPFALMNSAAAQCAIRYRLAGPNTTVANGRMSGLVGLRYGLRLLATGRAGAVICGAVEEYSEARELVERKAWGDVAIGEGCAVLYLEAGGNGLAEVLAVDTRLALAGSPADALAESLRAALRVAGLDQREVAALAVSSAEPVLLDVELAAVREVFARPVDRLLNPAELLGDTGAAGGVFSVAALLSAPAVGAEVAAMTCVDRDAMVGCAVFRLPAGGPGDE
jgi:3-oxoacyl-[acyl-carrier-protein] synthase II